MILIILFHYWQQDRRYPYALPRCAGLRSDVEINKLNFQGPFSLTGAWRL